MRYIDQPAGFSQQIASSLLLWFLGAVLTARCLPFEIASWVLLPQSPAWGSSHCLFLQFLQVFDELLLDADFSVNAGSWMWLSCSAFFQQFFHCYCPVGFGRRTDPSGDYVKRYLPKLKGFPSRYIYEPWNAPESVQKAAKCIIGVDYPKPMVNHAETSRLNIERMKQIYQQLSRYRGLCLLASVPSCVEDLSGPVADSASGQGCSTSTAMRLSQADQASPKRKHEGAEELCTEELYKRAKVTCLPAPEIPGKSL